MWVMIPADSLPPALCGQCGTALPPDGPAGHCPRCLSAACLTDLEGAGVVESVSSGGPAWSVLGDCELHEEIGRGGMGVVYRARQRRLGRWVAVKVLRGGEFAGGEARERFKAEAENAARLQHPGIVAVHDFGEEQGVCWISMELIAGRNLEEATRHLPLPARMAAECLRSVALAVQHAHEAGVLHRDLKPSNIIMDPEGAPHIADFGIARRVEGTGGLTRSGQLLGSPGFTAPEQALRGEADARTDVYGLGALLYSILTSRPPFQGPTAESLLVQLRDADPLPPRRLNPSVPRDLETIALKCLAREPARRYATAQAVADDLTAFLEGRPIQARPVSALEKAWRWCRRRPALAGALAFALLALVSGTLVSMALAREARGSAARALAAAEETREALYSATILRAHEDLRTGSPLAASALSKLTPSQGQRDLRGWEWHYLTSLLHQDTLRLRETRTGEPRAAAFSPDGKQLAISTLATPDSPARIVRILDAQTFAEKKTLTGYDREVPCLHWHPDNNRLLTCDASGTVSVWDVARGERVVRLTLDPVELSRYRPPRAAWSPDGSQFAAVSAKTGLTLHKADSGTLIRTLRGAATELVIAWHPAGDRIAAGLLPPALGIFPTDGSGAQKLPMTEPVTALAWSPDGLRLAAGTGGDRVSIHQPDKPEPSLTFELNIDAVGHLAWTPDGQRLIGGGWTGVPVAVDAARGTPEHFFYGHGHGWITSLALHEDRLLTWSKDATLREWSLRRTGDGLILPGTPARLQVVGSSDGLRSDIHVAEPFGRTAVWQANGVLRTETFRWARAIAWSPDGTRFALLRNLDPARYGLGALAKSGAFIETRRTAAPGLPSFAGNLRTGYPVEEMLWSPHADRLLLISATSNPPFCTVIHAGNGRELTRIPAAPHYSAADPAQANPAAWSPDDRIIALGTGSLLYDAATGLPANAAFTASMAQFSKAHGCPISCLAWSPDGTRLALGFAELGQVLLTDTASGSRLTLRTVHSGWVRSMAFSPDGTRLATCGRDRTVKLLDARTLDLLLVFKEHRTDVRTLAWSPDGRALWSADVEGNVVVRRLP